ncbi:hypothetical protein SAMN04488503_2023 [Humidesulfovibrio mexicanus]|uniref:Uncharacterized protein n=1 Tax=Humidesulfovibrio mexicanus TaxID=147047 RepID=A0A239AL74_9BACT|nr:hypothetical protein [Humidesulfovibrio mexicanus]SNR95683.1 hypothetical protein SAMN04488503_2023 [Humidesulfovibrio mexicanus]
MTVPRFVLARSAGDSVTLRDTQKKRLAAIFPRDTSLPEVTAEAAAVRMAEVCAKALNLVHEAAQAKKQQEGGK